MLKELQNKIFLEQNTSIVAQSQGSYCRISLALPRSEGLQFASICWLSWSRVLSAGVELALSLRSAEASGCSLGTHPARVSRALQDAVPRAQTRCSGCWLGAGGMQTPALGVRAADPSMPLLLAAPTLTSCREVEAHFFLAPGASTRISRG